MSDPLLTSLCSICHVRSHKYRCPRDSVLTCSLACSQRHKQWAQCNGVRNPAAYIKQKDLLTPKGIDHDYNYLTSLERQLDNADKDAASRGVILEEEVRSKGHIEKGEVNLRRAIERCGVIIVKAPKGMSRSKQNATQVTKKTHTLRWTIEWVQPNGTKGLGMCVEDQPLDQAYASYLASLDKDRPRKRKKPDPKSKANQQEDNQSNRLYPNAPTKADPTDPSHPSETPNTADSDFQDSESECEIIVSNEEYISRSKKRNIRRQATKRAKDARSQVDRETKQQLSAWKREVSSQEVNGALSSASNALTSNHDPLPPSNPAFPTTTQPPPSPLKFYLHHPSLPSPHPVLIPLASDTSLYKALPNRLVLEFPTIYVLHEQHDGKIPEGFINEEDYFSTSRREWVTEIGEEGEIVEEDGKNGAGMGGQVDERTLAEVLGKDLGGMNGLR